MKMKRISTILLALLMLISFTACNLDNNGILYRGPNRTPSDNKNRNYIGKTSDTVYFVSDDGLSMAKYSGGTLSSDQVISADNIFQHFYQSYGWIINDGSIIYVDDTRGSQDYYHVTYTDGQISKTPLTVTGNDSTPVFLYRYYDDSTPYLVMVSERIDDEKNPKADTVTVYSQSYTDDTMLQLRPIYTVNNYTGSENGLLWYETTKMNEDTGAQETVTEFMYAAPSLTSGNRITFWHEVTNEENSTNTEEVTVTPSTIQSVLQHDDTLYVLTSSDSQITIYSGDLSSPDSDTTVHLNERTTVAAYYNSSFPTYYVPSNAGEGKLIFLDYNISDSSELYCVDLAKLNSDEDKATTQTPLSSGIEAEAFIQFESQGNNDIVYMMTKNQGFYEIKIDDTSGSLSVRKI